MPISPADAHWETLFVHDLAVPGVAAALKEPFGAAAQAMSASKTFTAPQRKELAGVLQSLGDDVAGRLAGTFAPGGSLGPAIDVFGAIAALDRLLQRAEVKAGPSETEKAVGLGESFSVIREGLQEFADFLAAQQKALRARGVGLEQLAVQSRESELPRVVLRELDSIETSARRVIEPESRSLMVINYLENFMAYVKVSLLFGLALSLPFILWEAWKFVGAGLYPHEQKYVILFLPFSIGLFIVGVLFGYFAMIPVGLRFLASWGLEEVNLSITLGNYLGVFFTLTLVLGLVFQIPLVMVFLAKIGVVTVPGYRAMRKPAIFVLVVAAAIITPPDPVTLLMMAGPLVLLYELGIVTTLVLSRRKKKKDAASAD